MDKLRISKVINDMIFQHNNNPNNNENNNINNDNNNNNNNINNIDDNNNDNNNNNNINNIDDNNNDNNNNNDNDNNKKLNNDSIKNSIIFLEEINNSIKKDISQSVLDLTNCFICLSPTNDPLTCPKCNYFACKKCLEKYFEGKKEKKCPLCKRLIKLSELKENKIIKDIEQILNKEGDETTKFEELTKLIEEKRKSWGDQNNNIFHLIEKIFTYQEELEQYKKNYDVFLDNIKNSIKEIFKEISKNMENLANSLLSYNKVADESINNYNAIYKKTQNNLYDSGNFKLLINEILALERKQFNDITFTKTKQFLNFSIKIIPSIDTYNIKETKLNKNDFANKKFHFDGSHFKIGQFSLDYILNNKDGYKGKCILKFTLKYYYIKKMHFLLSQIIAYKNDKTKLIPMEFIKNEGRIYYYECQISCDDFFTLDANEVSIKTEALIFTVLNS